MVRRHTHTHTHTSFCLQVTSNDLVMCCGSQPNQVLAVEQASGKVCVPVYVSVRNCAQDKHRNRRQHQTAKTKGSLACWPHAHSTALGDVFACCFWGWTFAACVRLSGETLSSTRCLTSRCCATTRSLLSQGIRPCHWLPLTCNEFVLFVCCCFCLFVCFFLLFFLLLLCVLDGNCSFVA